MEWRHVSTCMSVSFLSFPRGILAVSNPISRICLSIIRGSHTSSTMLATRASSAEGTSEPPRPPRPPTRPSSTAAPSAAEP